MPEAADHHRATRVVGNRSSHGSHDHRHRHSGPLWQRPRCRILGGVYARVLEAEARQVGPVQGRAGRGGEYQFARQRVSKCVVAIMCWPTALSIRETE